MKHIWNHGIKDQQNQAEGKHYWRSVEEYSQTSEFKNWLEKEFPQGASEFWGDGLSRRNFVHLMGASMALAGLGMSGCRRPEAQIVAYTKTPEWQVSGKFMSYASAMPRRRGAIPLLVTTFDGRPTKIEGNPLYPIYQGSTDVFAQASILDLYDPDRMKRFVFKGANSSRKEFEAAVDQIRKQCLQMEVLAWLF